MKQNYSIDTSTFRDLAEFAQQGQTENKEIAGTIWCDARGKIVKHDLLEALTATEDHVSFDAKELAQHTADNAQQDLTTHVFHNHPNGTLDASDADKEVFAQQWGHHPIMTVCQKTQRTLLGMFDESWKLADISVWNSTGKVIALDTSGNVSALADEEVKEYSQAA